MKSLKGTYFKLLARQQTSIQMKMRGLP